MEQGKMPQAKWNWQRLPIVAKIIRLLCKELKLPNEYLQRLLQEFVALAIFSCQGHKNY